MLYNFQRKKLCRHLLFGGALFAAGLGMFSCSDTYDLDTDQPSNLNSIYGYMEQQGNFTNYLSLIDDLGQKEIFSKTGSKTVFIANDDAFKTFYASNPWGVKRYEDLSLAQKKLLLNSSMIDNPYSTSMLSTAEGPVKGEVCRRSTSQDLLDSVLVLSAKSQEAAAILPHNARFDEIRATHDSIVLFTDASQAAPMLHFNYKFIASNKLQSSDIDFIYNQPVGTRHNDDVYVNNAKVINPNIFCKNGFIHQVDRVILPFDNMAEIIRKDPETTVFSGIIERFAAPDSTYSLTQRYNAVKGTTSTDVFNKRYFSDRSAGSTRESNVSFSVDKNGGVFDASLKFDPGWTGYMPLSGEPRDAMMEDLAVMFVPTDSALNEWWENGGGKVIKDFYGTIEATPNSTIEKLVRVNQFESFISTVPSRFTDVLNDANEALGVTLDDIKEVKMGSNGLVYKTKKVFAPTSYSSVLFPSVVDTTNFKIIQQAIEVMDYDKYLNSMVSRYVFLLPTNDGLISYVDPVSYGTKESNLWEFHIDPTKTKWERLSADIYKCVLDESTGKWEKTGDKLTTVTGKVYKDNTGVEVWDRSTAIYDRVENLLNNIIVTSGYQEGKRYYKTKGNTYVRIDGITEGSHVYGGLQSEFNTPLPVKSTYNMENGTTLVLDGAIMGTRRSVAMQLNAHPEFSTFLAVLKACGAVNPENAKDKWASVAVDTLGNLFNLKDKGDIGAQDLPTGVSTKATYLLNNFHYTVYAPTNEAMQKAFDMGLPTLNDLSAAEDWDEMYDGLPNDEKTKLVNETGCCPGDSAGRVREAMLDFVKYHIQENSIYVDGGSEGGRYESAKTELIRSATVKESVTEDKIQDYNKDGKEIIEVTPSVANPGTYDIQYYTGLYSPGRPYKIQVNPSATGITVTDNIGQTHNVIIKDGLYNIQAAEYWIGSSNEASSTTTMRVTDNPYRFFITNSSSAVIHAIDGPLVYDKEQFKYTYKKLTATAKLRK